MSDLKQSIREIDELIDVVVTIRICNKEHPKSNTKLRKCAAMMAKRMQEPFVKGVCKQLAKSSNVVSDIVTLQQRLLSS